MSSSVRALPTRPPLPQGPRSRLPSSNYSPQTSRVIQSPPPWSPSTRPPATPDNLDPEDDSEQLSNEYDDLHPIPGSPPYKSASTSNIAVQVPTPPPVPDPVAIPMQKFVPLPKPPKLNFDSVPVPWKGLSLEAAQWTYSSQELQQIVSRAIRTSARESFIRLLSLESLDYILPQELDKLNTSKAVTQSKYRFLVQRRTMTLQALNSCSSHPTDRIADGISAVVKLTKQLNEITSQLDVLVEELVHITDQQAQVQRLQDIHWAGALAIALRKLNGSYGRRTAELAAAKDRITQLEGELEDAWKEAEKMAQEIDDMDMLGSDDEGDAIIEQAEIMFVPRPISITAPILLKSELSSPVENLTRPPDREVPQGTNLVSDTATIRSTRSGRSARSGRSFRSGDQSRIGLVSAAKTRSHRTSMGSLRTPTRRTFAYVDPEFKELPPVPSLPKAFMSSSHPNTRFGVSTDDINVSRIRNVSRSSLPSTIDDVGVSLRPRSYSVTTIVELQMPFSQASTTDGIDTTTDGIDVVEETHQFIDFSASQLPVSVSRSTSIPPFWIQADAPIVKSSTQFHETQNYVQETLDDIHETTAQTRKIGRVASASRLSRLKSLTQRYSLPFPKFSQLANGSSQNRPISHQSS